MNGRRQLTAFEIYRWPLLVAVAVALGLAAALSGRIVARWFAWFALALPLVVILACLIAGQITRKRA